EVEPVAEAAAEWFQNVVNQPDKRINVSRDAIGKGAIETFGKARAGLGVPRFDLAHKPLSAANPTLPGGEQDLAGAGPQLRNDSGANTGGAFGDEVIEEVSKEITLEAQLVLAQRRWSGLEHRGTVRAARRRRHRPGGKALRRRGGP